MTANGDDMADGATGYDAMSDYERRAWDEAVKRLNDRSESRVRGVARGAGQKVRGIAGKGWMAVPGHELFEEQLTRALGGLAGGTLQMAMQSVQVDRVARRVGMDSLTDFHTLDLSKLDAALPRNRLLYGGAALVEGAATALAVTGAEVATTVSAGTSAGVAAAAVATDVAASIGFLGRITAHVASQYGYDVRLPEEEVFALGVISLGSAGSPSMKVAALTSLSRLTQEMMRQATWKTLNEHASVKLVDAIFGALGTRLTKQKLGQAIPIVGIVLNGGMSAEMADRTFRRARDLYRLRFLSDKYDIDPTDWVADAGVPVEEDDVLDTALDALEDEAATEAGKGDGT